VKRRKRKGANFNLLGSGRRVFELHTKNSQKKINRACRKNDVDYEGKKPAAKDGPCVVERTEKSGEQKPARL